MRGVECIDQALIRRAEETAVRACRAGLQVVTAESCTAGLVAAVLAQTDKAGEVLQGGFVVYTNAAKSKSLDVNADVLANRGAVNETVAIQMCVGALSHSIADIAIATTGVLGPSPGENGNPVGLIFWAVARRGRRPRVVSKHYASASPDELRRQAVLEALVLIDYEIGR